MIIAYYRYDVYTRFVIYRYKEEGSIPITASIENDDTRHEFASHAPTIFVGPPMTKQRVLLQAWKDNKNIGECQCDLYENLQIIDATGYFAKVQQPIELIGKETIQAKRSDDAAGLSSTDVLLLSRKWQEMHQLNVKEGLVGWWDDNGIDIQDMATHRFTGWSLKHGALCDLHAALVAVISGPQMHYVDYLLWGDDGGIRIGGGPGKTMSAAFVLSWQQFPKRLEAVLLPPEYIKKR